MRLLPARLRAALERLVFGLTADEIRYTFEDVRAELRAARAELREELEAIRRDLDRLAGRPAPPRQADADDPSAPGAE